MLRENLDITVLKSDRNELYARSVHHWDKVNEEESCSSDVVLRICKVVLDDLYLSKAWEIVQRQDQLYNEKSPPLFEDFLMHVFSEGFKEGMKYEQERTSRELQSVQE